MISKHCHCHVWIDDEIVMGITGDSGEGCMLAALRLIISPFSGYAKLPPYNKVLL